jgi:CRISPR/Cas system-associated exonuclease Cas4 (RecB family)
MDMNKKLTLSHSKIDTFNQCPQKYKLIYMEDMVKLGSQAMKTGIENHENMKKALTDKTVALPEKVIPIINQYFLNPEPVAESDITVSVNKDIDLRGIIDAYSIKEDDAYIIDWKTGMIPENESQLKMYSFILLASNPNLERFTAWFYSLELDFYKRYTFFYNEVIEYRDKIIEIGDKILSEKEFKKNPTSKCGICPFVYKCFNEEQIHFAKIINDKDIEKLGEYILLADAYSDQMKAILKTYMLENHINEIELPKNESRFYLTNTVMMKAGKLKKK